MMSDEKGAPPEIREYASPPCFMHELEPGYRAETASLDAWADVARWRKAERARLIDERLLADPEKRKARSERIAAELDLAIGKVSGRIALPVVIKKAWPLEFRAWSPGDPLERGVWNILVPANGPAILPDIVIAPVVGFDDTNYRLGYGGGFFDRTLAAMPKRPLVIGVGYAGSRIATIYPQPHDIPMDIIVTDE
jgi:5-formyltetrahydrofolate cyclo-ligase